MLTNAERLPPGKADHIGPEAIAAVRLLALTGMRRDATSWSLTMWCRGSILRGQRGSSSEDAMPCFFMRRYRT